MCRFRQTGDHLLYCLQRGPLEWKRSLRLFDILASAVKVTRQAEVTNLSNIIYTSGFAQKQGNLCGSLLRQQDVPEGEIAVDEGAGGEVRHPCRDLRAPAQQVRRGHRVLTQVHQRQLE